MTLLLPARGEDSAADGPLFLFVFTPKCYDVFLTNGLFSLNFIDIWDLDCIKITISKGLSVGIILGSFLLKAPQIYNICVSADVSGLSPSAFYFDLLGYLLSPVYNMRTGVPIGQYAENFTILIQNAVLVLLVRAAAS